MESNEQGAVAMRFSADLMAIFAQAKTPNDFCKQVVHVALRKFGATASGIATVQNDSSLFWAGAYGTWITEVKQSNVSIWDDSPLSEAIRTGEKTVLDAPRVSESPPASGGAWLGKSLLVLPLSAPSQNIGAFFIVFSGADLALNLPEEHCDLLQLSASLLANTTKRISLEGTWNENVGNTQIGFTERELEIISRIGEGKTNSQIGFALRVSESTVKQDCLRIFRKLNVTSRQAAFEAAKELGFI